MIGNFHDQFLGEFGRGDAPILTRHVIWHKRLEKGTFKLPTVAASCEVDATAFMMLLKGVDAKSI